MVLAGATGLALTAPIMRSCIIGKSQENLANPATLNLLFNKDVIRNIGDSYLNQNPEENNPEFLSRALQGELDLSKLNDVEKDFIISQKIMEDYRNERIVIIEGYIISRTEARQCALSYLN